MKLFSFLMLSIFSFSLCSAQTNEEYIKKGKAFIEAKQYQEALESLNEAIKLKPELPEAYYQRGLAKSNLGDMKSAISDFNKSLTNKPDNIFDIYIARGKAKEAIRDYPGATADYDKAIELNPLSQEPYFNKAREKIAMKDYHGAINDADEAISINPDYSEAYIIRGVAKENLNQKQSGCMDFNKAQQLGDNKAAYAIKEYCN